MGLTGESDSSGDEDANVSDTSIPTFIFIYKL